MRRLVGSVRRLTLELTSALRRRTPRLIRRSRNPSLIITAALLTGAAAACGRLAGDRVAVGRAVEVCPTYATSALSVRVEDARTGARIAKGATMSVSYNGREPGVHTFEADSDIYTVFSEAGRYDVRVTKPGYRPWERRGIVRPDLDGCGHTSPADVVARLDRDR